MPLPVLSRRHERLSRPAPCIDGSWFRNQFFYPAVKAAGITFKVTPKSMRDAHASWLLAGGADLQIVKERLGHGSITTTEQYLGTLPRAGEAALSALDAIRGARIPADTQTESSTAKEGAPDKAELLKMMATIMDTYERLAT